MFVRLQEPRDQSRPAGLMSGAEAMPGLAVEVFMEQEVITELRVTLYFIPAAKHRSVPFCVAPKQPAQTLGQRVGNRVD